MGFFRDITTSVGFLIALLLMVLAVIALVAGKAGTTTFGEGATYVLAALKLGLNFAMGITVLLVGVRMLIAEIVPAFRGIAQKVVPNAVPALDVPVIFDFAPMAVIVGFLSATVAFFILMILFGPILKWAIIVPPFIMLFFPGGAGGVFGNATGGFKGAILGGAICGILLAVGQAVVTPMLSTTAPELAQLADPDWYIFVLILKPLFSLILPH
jgi:PTS system ascorbate-specific IIC component